jgi:hypothetical protein
MGTSRNQRSPAELRWRVVQAAYAGGSAPRALTELFRAASTDGWLASLASPACAAYGQAAADAAHRVPGLLAEADSAGVVVRQIVDEARLAALDSPALLSAGLIPALAERALTCVLVSHMQGPNRALSQASPAQALRQWQRQPPTASALASEQLVETIRQVVLHLVHRDGPQLTGGPVGGSSAISTLARELAATAAKVATPAARDMPEYVGRAWPVAVNTAWEAARDLVRAAEGLQRPRPTS